MSKMTKKQLEKALELACDRILKVTLKDVQMTLYDGKWEEMVKDKKAHFIALAKEKKS